MGDRGSGATPDSPASLEPPVPTSAGTGAPSPALAPPASSSADNGVAAADAKSVPSPSSASPSPSPSPTPDAAATSSATGQPSAPASARSPASPSAKSLSASTPSLTADATDERWVVVPPASEVAASSSSPDNKTAPAPKPDAAATNTTTAAASQPEITPVKPAPSVLSALLPSSAPPKSAEVKQRDLADQRRLVEAALNAQPSADVAALRRLAVGGFVDDALRRRVWCRLLGVTDAELRVLAPHYTRAIHVHRYFEQVGKDIDRSMFHFDVTRAYGDRRRARQRRVLERVIHGVFSGHPTLHYIQGFHDVASVFVLVCGGGADGEDMAYALVERLSLLHLRDSLRPSLDVVMQLLSCVFPLVGVADPPLHAFVVESGVMSFVLLSWVLTWFAHNLERFASVVRVFDLLVASHPAMAVYVTASLVVQLRAPLLALDCDMPAMHAFFQNVPAHLIDADIDGLLARAVALYELCPPAALYALATPPLQIPADSLLHVAADPAAVADLPDRVAGAMAARRDEVQRTLSGATANGAGAPADAAAPAPSSSSSAASSSAASNEHKTAPHANPRPASASASTSGASDEKAAPADAAAAESRTLAPSPAAPATAVPAPTATTADAAATTNATTTTTGELDLSALEARFWVDRKRDAAEREQKRVDTLVRNHIAQCKREHAAAVKRAQKLAAEHQTEAARLSAESAKATALAIAAAARDAFRSLALFGTSKVTPPPPASASEASGSGNGGGGAGPSPGSGGGSGPSASSSGSGSGGGGPGGGGGSGPGGAGPASAPDEPDAKQAVSTPSAASTASLDLASPTSTASTASFVPAASSPASPSGAGPGASDPPAAERPVPAPAQMTAANCDTPALRDALKAAAAAAAATALASAKAAEALAAADPVPGTDPASLAAVRAAPKTARELEQERVRADIDVEQWSHARRRLLTLLPRPAGGEDTTGEDDEPPTDADTADPAMTDGSAPTTTAATTTTAGTSQRSGTGKAAVEAPPAQRPAATVPPQSATAAIPTRTGFRLPRVSEILAAMRRRRGGGGGGAGGATAKPAGTACGSSTSASDGATTDETNAAAAAAASSSNGGSTFLSRPLLAFGLVVLVYAIVSVRRLSGPAAAASAASGSP